MKRLLSLVLVAAFALPLVIGCSSEEPKKAPAAAPKAGDTPKAPATPPAGDKK